MRRQTSTAIVHLLPRGAASKKFRCYNSSPRLEKSSKSVTSTGLEVNDARIAAAELQCVALHCIIVCNTMPMSEWSYGDGHHRALKHHPFQLRYTHIRGGCVSSLTSCRHPQRDCISTHAPLLLVHMLMAYHCLTHCGLVLSRFRRHGLLHSESLF